MASKVHVKCGLRVYTGFNPFCEEVGKNGTSTERTAARKKLRQGYAVIWHGYVVTPVLTRSKLITN